MPKKNERFVSEYAEVVKPACATCQHRSSKSMRHCLAFPSGKGIPVGILLGKNDHTQPVEGDHGIQYKAKS